MLIVSFPKLNKKKKRILQVVSEHQKKFPDAKNHIYHLTKTFQDYTAYAILIDQYV
jgi:hypothetical protein